ncbi:MAG: capsid cement protein [Candidatus Gastranaerophilaceae bacterium]
MRTYRNQKAITAHRFVKFADGFVENSISAKDDIVGISDIVNSQADDFAEIYLPGELAEIEAGGTFEAGDALTSDTQGRAVKAQAGDNIGAVATDAASSGDVVEVIVSLQRFIAAEETNENDQINQSEQNN